MEKTFVRTHAVLDLTISISLIISGLTLVFLPTSQSVNVLGFFLLASGIITIILWKSGYKDIETGEKYSKQEHFFAQSEKPHIEEAIDKHKFENIDFKMEDKGNGLRIDIYVNKAKSIAYVQAFEYIPYKYEAFTLQLEVSHDELLNRFNR